MVWKGLFWTLPDPFVSPRIRWNQSSSLGLKLEPGKAESSVDSRPRIALTLGDVAGVGPELAVKLWSEPQLHAQARLVVIGSRKILERAVELLGSDIRVIEVAVPGEVPATTSQMVCIDAAREDLSELVVGQIDARAGQASLDFLNRAIDLALRGAIDAITTLPLQKESLRLAGVPFPGHTEILAERCGVREHAMMLFVGPPISRSQTGLAVLHATLHVPLRAVFDLLTPGRVAETILLADRALRPLTQGRPPRIGVAGLNPHAGEHGLFGTEEIELIEPIILQQRMSGIDVHGPYPADTLFRRGLDGEFDAVIAMYHDQGHAAIKSVAFHEAVNVTLGLPIVRTSVAHGTAFDIAWKGMADPSSLRTAVLLAARIVTGRQSLGL